jgi:hypothetical protein
MTRSFGDLIEEALAAGVLVAGKRETVGDVVEEQALSSQFKGTKETTRRLGVVEKTLNSGATGDHRVSLGIPPSSVRLRSGLGDLGKDFFFFFRWTSEMVFGQSIAEEGEGVFRRVDELEQV